MINSSLTEDQMADCCSSITDYVSLHGPTAALVKEVLQLPASDFGVEQFTITSHRCGLIVQSVPAVTKDIVVG